jgi:hemolysin-activating ACP:hemolysin acyltransferase
LIEIINFLKKFKEYQEYSEENLKAHIQPSYELNQYKIFKDDEITGFVNWAFLNEIQKTKFINHAIIDQTNWNCGDNLCLANFVSSKNILDMVNWCKRYFFKQLKYDNAIWVKAFRNNRIMKVSNKWHK